MAQLVGVLILVIVGSLCALALVRGGQASRGRGRDPHRPLVVWPPRAHADDALRGHAPLNAVHDVRTRNTGMGPATRLATFSGPATKGFHRGAYVGRDQVSAERQARVRRFQRPNTWLLNERGER